MRSCLAHEDVRLGFERNVFGYNLNFDGVKRSFDGCF